jgi:hypothetical protein
VLILQPNGAEHTYAAQPADSSCGALPPIAALQAAMSPGGRRAEGTHRQSHARTT